MSKTPGSPLGRVLRRARLQQDITQDDFARSAGLSKQLISQLECEPRDVRMSTLDRLGSAMGIRGSDLLRLVEDERAAAAPTARGTTRASRRG